MKPARPFHINTPRQRANGEYVQEDFEVVGHRDGPVVARFPFDPKDSESVGQAFRLAQWLCEFDEAELVKVIDGLTEQQGRLHALVSKVRGGR